MACDAHGKAKISGHLANQKELLPVFLPENGKIRVEEMEELEDNGQDPFEVARSRGSAVKRSDGAGIDRYRGIRRDNLFGAWQKEQIGSSFLEEGDVLFRGAGITCEIFGRTELERVHEDRDGNKSSLGLSPVD